MITDQHLPITHTELESACSVTEVKVDKRLHMLTFIIKLYCPKAHHKHDHSTCIVECHRKLLFLNPTSPGLDLRPLFLQSIHGDKQVSFWRRSVTVLSFRAT